MAEECPLCEQGLLIEIVEKNWSNHKGVYGYVPLHYSVCDHCGSELANAKQVRRNKEEMIKFKTKIDRQQMVNP